MKPFFTTFLLLMGLTLTAQTYITVATQPTTGGTPYTVNNYKITYNTTDVFGAPTVASGLISIPSDRGNAYPLAVYNHGTVADRNAVPSRVTTFERILPQTIASNGFITLSPDYLGLGDNPGIHPYVHADSEASAGRDLLLAARQWLREEGIAFNQQLFLTGYSQGGHATQALHRDLQLNPGNDSLTVTAASHLSGPYSISDVMREALFAETQATIPGYIIYTYISYNYVYDLFDSFTEIFQPEYVPNIDSLAMDQISPTAFNARLEQQIQENDAILADIFQDSIRIQLETNDTTSQIIMAMRDNDTYDWAPIAPTLIYYCTADEQVPFRNAILADSAMAANGSTSVTLASTANLTHGLCISPAFNRTLELFLPLANISPVSLGAIVDAPEISLSPNPVVAGTVLNIKGLSLRAHNYLIYDQSGRETARGSTNASGQLTLPTNLNTGVQVLRLDLGDGRSVVRRFLIK